MARPIATLSLVRIRPPLRGPRPKNRGCKLPIWDCIIEGPSGATARPVKRAMTAATQQLFGHSAEKPRSIPAFGRLWLIAFALVVLAAEVGWVALLGYGLVFLFS
jgi:hypothetical protein